MIDSLSLHLGALFGVFFGILWGVFVGIYVGRGGRGGGDK